MTAEESKAAEAAMSFCRHSARFGCCTGHRGEWDSLIEGDILILCTDGLWNMVDDAAIAETAARSAPQEACQQLVDAALAAGGYDNVSWAYSSCARLPAGRPSRKGRRGRLRLPT